MAKRFREFRRIKLTARVARFIQEALVDKTFNDHYSKCDGDDEDCYHHESGTLYVARLVEPNLRVGAKRGYLDIPCPWYQPSPEDHIGLLDILVARLRNFAENTKDLNPRTKAFVLQVCEEIDAYAHRNAMEVLAETVVDVERD